jgi:sec-independent protein translocase protein TatC
MLGGLIPSLADMPMSLGDHLDELRRRLIFPVIAFVVLFIVGFALDNQLKEILVQPLLRAIDIVGPETAAKVGFDPSKGTRILTVFGVGESAMLSMRVAMIFAISATIPIFLYQAWAFVAVGLKSKERALGLLFVPAGAVCFYIGLVFAYYWGLPYLQAWLISWTANDVMIGQMDLRATTYFGDFLQFGVAIGLIFDIPWLVVVLVRVGMVTPAWLATKRRYVVLVNIVLAAMLTPTSDATTLMITFIPMQMLFEVGLFVSRLFQPRSAILNNDDDHEDDHG